MAFCPKCGKQLNDGAAFCLDCGTAIASNQNPQYQQPQQQPQYQQPQQQPQYQQPQPQYQQQPYGQFQPQVTYQVKPKIPGRGFGITSMVLGIIALVYAVIDLIDAIEVSSNYSWATDFELVENAFTVEFIILGILSVLSVAFGICAIVKNFKKGQTISGLIMGGLSLIMLVVSIILVA